MLATKTKVEVDLTKVDAVLLEATVAAKSAAEAMYKQIGDRDCCGFAWVSVYDVRSNSKLGKRLQAAGFKRAYGGGLQLWDPAHYPTQSMTVLEAGAYAYAAVLEGVGLKAYAGSRMD
jgi:hypothetical protein